MTGDAKIQSDTLRLAPMPETNTTAAIANAASTGQYIRKNIPQTPRQIRTVFDMSPSLVIPAASGRLTDRCGYGRGLSQCDNPRDEQVEQFVGIALRKDPGLAAQSDP